MSVEALPGYLKQHWPAIRADLVVGSYRPQPARRVDIPKGNGKTRPLGILTWYVTRMPGGVVGAAP